MCGTRSAIHTASCVNCRPNAAPPLPQRLRSTFPTTNDITQLWPTTQMSFPQLPSTRGEHTASPVFEVSQKLEKLTLTSSRPIVTPRLSATEINVAKVRWSAKSIKGRAYQNEDSHVVSRHETADGGQCCIFGVFDGHGGKAAANFCRERFVDFVTCQPPFVRSRSGSSSNGHELENATGSARDGASQPRPSTAEAATPSLVHKALHKAFIECDKAFIALDAKIAAATRSRNPCPQGCAALSVVLEPHRLTVANAGDCRAVLRYLMHVLACSFRTVCHIEDMCAVVAARLFRFRKIIARWSRKSANALWRPGHGLQVWTHEPLDHTACDAVHMCSLLCLATGANGKYCLLPRKDVGLSLSRSIGDREFKACNGAIVATPDVVSIPLTNDDEFIVLACDGTFVVRNNFGAVMALEPVGNM